MDPQKPDSNPVTVALTILADNPDAQRLVLSWPRVPADLADAAMRKAWARLAGVRLSQVKNIADMLFGHGIISQDRTVTQAAFKVLDHLSAERLRAKKPAGRGK